MSEEVLEYQIAMALLALSRINFGVAIGECNAGSKSPTVLMPVAYAMFKFLLRDIDGDPDIWQNFLREALKECTYQEANHL